jgi:hypothetical protein
VAGCGLFQVRLANAGAAFDTDHTARQVPLEASAFGCEAVGVTSTSGFFVYLLDLCLTKRQNESRHLLNKSMKKKMGRPMLSDSAKDVLIGARFGGEEAKQVHAAVKRAKLGKSEWVRKTLLSAAKL